MDLRPTAAAPSPAAPIVVAGKLAQAPAVSDAAPPQSAKALQRPEPAPSAEQVDEALESINSALQARSQDLEFSIDKDSDRTVVTVTDKDTKEVIRQMPTREAMEIAKALDKLQSLLSKQSA